MSLVHATQSPTPDEVVILVHGTYAGRESDVGDSWWQRGSQVWQQLSRRLPKGVQLTPGRLFHWSGENSERERIKAAGELLGELQRLESSGTDYHLVGHSHGGSVIWHALRLATLRKVALDGMRSWATVGTPFLHHRSPSIWHVFNIAKIALAIFLVKPAIWTATRLFQLVGAALFGWDHGVRLPSEGPGWVARNPGIVLDILPFFGIPVEHRGGEWVVGTFDSSNQTIIDYVFATPEGWTILAIAVVAAYVYLNLSVFCVSPVLESLRMQKEKRFERQVMDQFQPRWLGIWSPEDEAINGLRATLELSVSFVSRMTPRESILSSDRLSLIASPHRWILTPIYNAAIRPFLDGLVRSRVIKTAQGNNRPSAEVVAVSESPVDLGDREKLPSLPGWLNEKLTAEADRHARDIAPKLRKLIAEPSFVSGLATFGQTISGRELVHTSYFDHGEVLDLLALHIARTTHKGSAEPSLDHQCAELLNWLHLFQSNVGQVVRSTDRSLIVPRRRAA